MNKHFLFLAMLFIAFTGFAQNPCGKAYVRGFNPPWGQNTNEQAMDIAFGAGNWDNLQYSTVNAATLFSPAYGVVVLEGSDGTANELEAFLNANLPAIEAWVFQGNALMINAAPNQGNGMNYGFGGVTLTYPSFVPNASSPNPGHPIFAGPALPVTTAYTGNFYGHAVICPPALPASVLMANQANANAHVAVEATWGAGYVIFGGMTTTNWHSPNPQAMNLRANMFSHLEANGCGAAPPGGGDCLNNACVTVVCPPDVTVQCIEDFTPDATNATAISACGAIIGQWVTQPHQTGGPNCDGTTYVYTYKAADDTGEIGCCEQVVTIANNPPTISVIAGGTVECAADIETDASDATVTTSCGEELDVTIYAPVITGTANCPATTYTYTYRVEDQCEREATVDRVFTIQNTAPTIQAPANTTCECLGGITPNGANATVDVSCDLGYDVTAGITSTSGTQDCPGSTVTATYSVTDDCNRSASANQIFTIQNGPPVFLNAPANCLILNCEDQGWQDIIQAWLANVKATNSCGLPLTVTNNYNPNSQGVCISNGTTVVTWTTRDQCFRTSTFTSMIIINDTEAPVFTTPAQDELDICNYNTQAEFAAWVAAHGNSVAVDGCDQNIASNQWSTIPNNPQFPNCLNAMGPTSMSVTFVVRDDCGNKTSSTATFTALMAGSDFAEQGDGEVEAVNEFELYQNQPNPFSNETLIGFSLPKAGTATLTIYDISGKVVRLVEGDYSQGYNEVQINRSDLNSAGMLYYELNTADHTAVKKMIIID